MKCKDTVLTINRLVRAKLDWERFSWQLVVFNIYERRCTLAEFFRQFNQWSVETFVQIVFSWIKFGRNLLAIFKPSENIEKFAIYRLISFIAYYDCENVSRQLINTRIIKKTRRRKIQRCTFYDGHSRFLPSSASYRRPLGSIRGREFCTASTRSSSYCCSSVSRYFCFWISLLTWTIRMTSVTICTWRWCSSPAVASHWCC